MVRMRGNLRRQLQLPSTAGQLKSLERMLDENGRNDARGGLASRGQTELQEFSFSWPVYFSRQACALPIPRLITQFPASLNRIRHQRSRSVICLISSSGSLG